MKLRTLIKRILDAETKWTNKRLSLRAQVIIAFTFSALMVAAAVAYCLNDAGLL